MAQATHQMDVGNHQPIEVRPGANLSLLSTLKRYPIFLLAFGPPLIRSAGVDATKGMIDVWSFVQVGLLVVVAIRAIYRLISAEAVLIPKRIRSILNLMFLLGLVFLVSAIYSPSRLVSAAYSIFYLLNLICITEFTVDTYKNPPNWMQFVFHLRLIAFLLFILVLAVLPFAPQIVFTYIQGAGIRLLGGPVAPVVLVCPAIAVISAYSLLHSLESRRRSAFFLAIGFLGTLVTQSRGAELALLLSLAVLGINWAAARRRSALLFLFWSTVCFVLSSSLAGFIGLDQVWNTFNRNESVEGIKSASGRTDIWEFVIKYCLRHPQGMGYVAGFRVYFKNYSNPGLQVIVSHIGGAHNAFIQVLSDAGWLSLVLYLIVLVKTIALGRKVVMAHYLNVAPSDRLALHAIRCSLVLLILCLAGGMEDSAYSMPLREPFYFQSIVIAIILGVSARMIAACRAQNRALSA